MTAPHPQDFARIKAKLAKRDDRDPLKKSKDAAQARITSMLCDEYLVA